MFKKIYLLVFSGFLILNSCGSDEPKTTFTDTTFTTKKNTFVEVIIPVAFGKESIVGNINAVVNDSVIKMLNLDVPKGITIKTIEQGIDALNAEYNSFNSDFPEATQPWEAQIDGEIMYQSTELISISLTSYLNTGGAHGILKILFLNFDAKTGKPIKTSDLFNNMEDFNALANTYFENTIENKDVLFDPQSFKLPENIGFNDEGAILLYNTYEIAPYSTGILEFTIPFEKLNALLNFDSAQ